MNEIQNFTMLACFYYCITELQLFVAILYIKLNFFFDLESKFPPLISFTNIYLIS